MGLIISERIMAKIAEDDHGNISPKEVQECFDNHCGGFCTDDRESHKTNPPTLWFVSETNQRRKLKITYVRDGSDVFLKSAYLATAQVTHIYERYCKF